MGNNYRVREAALLRYAIVLSLVARFPSLAARLRGVFSLDAILLRPIPVTSPNCACDIFQDVRGRLLLPAIRIARPASFPFEPTTHGHRSVAAMERVFHHWSWALSVATSYWDSAIDRTARGKTGTGR